MVEIQIINNQDIIEIAEDSINNWVKSCTAISEYLKITDKVISVALTDNEVIRSLNSQYRGKDYATDVLSFPLSQIDSEEPLLGEIIISMPVASKQAEEFDNTLQEEVNFLLLHGILHLTGYDHDDEHRGEMRDKEKEIAEALGLKNR